MCQWRGMQSPTTASIRTRCDERCYHPVLLIRVKKGLVRLSHCYVAVHRKSFTTPTYLVLSPRPPQCIASLQAAADATHRLHPAASKFPATRLSVAVSVIAAAAALAALMSSANAYLF